MTDNNLNIESDDFQLINSFREGNAVAFNLLVRKYQKRIYGLIRKMVLNHDDADDITQEVFIKLHNSVSEFRGDSKFYTYLYRIAVNYSLNHLSKNKKMIIKKENIEDSEIQSEDDTADDNFDSVERTRLLEKAIASLPDRQRAVFNLRYYENLSYDEISSILKKSEGGLKANYFHALKNLQKFLNSYKMKELFENK